MTLLRCMQVLPRRSELTNLARVSRDQTVCELRPATLCRLLSSYTSYASNLATAWSSIKGNNGGNPKRYSLSMIQAGSLPRFELNCTLNEIRTGGYARKSIWQIFSAILCICLWRNFSLVKTSHYTVLPIFCFVYYVLRRLLRLMQVRSCSTWTWCWMNQPGCIRQYPGNEPVVYWIQCHGEVIIW